MTRIKVLQAHIATAMWHQGVHSLILETPHGSLHHCQTIKSSPLSTTEHFQGHSLPPVPAVRPHPTSLHVLWRH